MQIRGLFNLVNQDIDSVLSGQLVPFRPPTGDELPRSGECLAIGQELWSDIIEYVNPKLIIAKGKTQVRPTLLDILGKPNNSEDVLVVWGNVKAGLDIYSDRRVVSLPHLSRFGIVNRPQSLSSLKYLFDIN